MYFEEVRCTPVLSISDIHAMKYFLHTFANQLIPLLLAARSQPSCWAGKKKEKYSKRKRKEKKRKEEKTKKNK